MNQPQIKIGRHVIDQDASCFVIAEIGHNHQGSLETAKKLIDEAAAAGAGAVKFQKRDNRALYTKAMYERLYDNENSFGLTYGEHREALEFGFEEYRLLKKYAERKGMLFFATAFDFESVAFLEELGVKAYKIASGDITNLPLIDHIARLGKPMFMSTGASSLDEVRLAYATVRQHHNKMCILQCTAAYPADPKDIHLNVISVYRREFPDIVIGYSGHDNGIALPLVAYVLGARVIEKHFTLNRAMKGTDHAFSLEPQGLRKMIRDLSRAYEAFGSPEKQCYAFERAAREKMGKSLVLSRAVKGGEKLTKSMIAFKSPGDGIPPIRLNEVLGRELKEALPKETMLGWDHFEP